MIHFTRRGGLTLIWHLSLAQSKIFSFPWAFFARLRYFEKKSWPSPAICTVLTHYHVNHFLSCLCWCGRKSDLLEKPDESASREGNFSIQPIIPFERRKSSPTREIVLREVKSRSVFWYPNFFSSPAAYLTTTSVLSDHWHYPEEKPNGVLEGKSTKRKSFFYFYPHAAQRDNESRS